MALISPLRRWNTLSVLGESGCVVKSTFTRYHHYLVEATDGEVMWLGQDLTKMQVQRRETRKEIQMIFQDPL